MAARTNGLRAGNKASNNAKSVPQPITAEDIINAGVSEYNEDGFNSGIKAKLDSAARILRIRHGDEAKVDATKYDNVYITSDLHADYRKLIEILNVNGFIDIKSSDDDSIYDTKNITETEWKPKRTLLIIVGDLVDGQRPSIGAVKDPRGCFELYIHMFLYNLRLKAIDKGSDIIFTIGNHDFETIYANALNLSRYVHQTAITYFNGLSPRTSALTGFYECSPYLFIQIVHEDKTKIVCVHGGMHNEVKKKGGVSQHRSYPYLMTYTMIKNH